jgi:hypothetical protein
MKAGPKHLSKYADLRPLEALYADARKAVQSMEPLVEGRVGRDELLTLITDAYAALQVLARRVGAAEHGFSARGIRSKRPDEEDKADRDQRTIDQEAAASVSLLDVLDDSESRPSEWRRKMLEEVLHDLEYGSGGDAVGVLHKFGHAESLKALSAMIAYIWHKAETPWEMMKRALAITRRYQRSTIKGITMTQVAALLDEKSRCAAVSARERDIHNSLLEAWGIRAPNAADGGLKSKATREKNRLRAMGNSNRKGKKNQPTSPHVGAGGHEKRSNRSNHKPK